MHPRDIETKIELAEAHGKQARHPEALAIIEDIKHHLPNSPILLRMRVENLAALGRTNEAVHDCDRLLQCLGQIRKAGNALDVMLDIEQAVQLAELVTEQTDRTGTLKTTLDRRQAEALDKETLQGTVAELQARLESFLTQRDEAAREQAALHNELSALREKERNTTEELEKAHSELDHLKHTLLKRESEIAEAENELAEREQLVARLENEVESLQQRSETAAQSEELLNQELERLRKQTDAKSAELDQARNELETLHRSLDEREKAVEEAQAHNREHEETLEAMRGEMQRIHGEADKAAAAQETLKNELEQLRENERDKSEALDAARAQLTTLQSQLGEREEAIAAAEARAREGELEIAQMRNQLDQIEDRAVAAADSEKALAEEVAQLRANESTKTADLQKTRQEMDRLRQELQGRESLLIEQLQQSELSAEAEKTLQEELDALRGRVQHFADSERDLVDELEHLRTSEMEKSKVLDTARGEMDALRKQLALQQEAVVQAEDASTQYDAVVKKLQQDLDALQEQAEHASTSEAELSREVSVLRDNEAAKTKALETAQVEMEQLREQLTQREREASDAEAVSAQKQQELEQLSVELESLRTKARDTEDAETALTLEMDKLRRNAEDKNVELEQSRKELDSLKKVLNEREKAATHAAHEQEASRQIITRLEDELAALRNKSLEQQSSQNALQAEVAQIHDAAQREGILDDSPQAEQLKKIQDQLIALEQERRDEEQSVRQEAVRKVTEQIDEQDDSDSPQADGSQLFALNYALSSQSKNRTQVEAMKLAQQQSRRQSPRDAEALARQQSQRQTPAEAALLAAQEPSRRQTPAEVAALAAQEPSQRQTPAEAAALAAQEASQRQTQQEAAKLADTSPPPVPTLPEEDDVESELEENYPKPRDVAYVFPDQSISIAVQRSSSSVRIVLVAGVLFLIFAGGTAAFLAQRMMSRAANTETAATAPAVPQEQTMLTFEFPEDRSFGTLYDHSLQPASDAEWPVFARAQGIIEYPEGTSFHLVVRRDHADDLSPLAKLPPNSLTSMWLPQLDVTDENLAYLHSLQRLSLIYIDQEMTDRERQRVAEGFQGGPTVTSKVPGAVMRDLTPPDARVFSFPEERSAGRVAIRRWNEPNEPWQYLDAARGEVNVPARMEVQIEIASGITDLSFLSMLDASDIHTLVLTGPAITDQSLVDAAHLRGLIVLELKDTQVGNAGMEALGAVRGLQTIRISGTQLTNDDLEVFKDLPHLSRIEIAHAPNINSGSFTHFRSLRVLRRLDLQHTAISPQQLRMLDQDLTSCSVTPLQ